MCLERFDCLDRIFRVNVQEMLCGTLELGLSDKSWNMITMNPTAHRFWSKVYFGLEWKGIVGISRDMMDDGNTVEYSHVTVKFHWLPDVIPDALEAYLRSDARRSELAPARLVRLDTDPDRESIAEILEAQFRRSHPIFPKKNASLRDSHGRLIETGRIFTLKIATEDLPKTKATIDLIWLAAKMASFAGAGEVIEELDRTPPSPPNPPQIFLAEPAVHEEARVAPSAPSGME